MSVFVYRPWQIEFGTDKNEGSAVAPYSLDFNGRRLRF